MRLLNKQEVGDLLDHDECTIILATLTYKFFEGREHTKFNPKPHSINRYRVYDIFNINILQEKLQKERTL